MHVCSHEIDSLSLDVQKQFSQHLFLQTSDCCSLFRKFRYHGDQSSVLRQPKSELIKKLLIIQHYFLPKLGLFKLVVAQIRVQNYTKSKLIALIICKDMNCDFRLFFNRKILIFTFLCYIQWYCKYSITYIYICMYKLSIQTGMFHRKY